MHHRIMKQMAQESLESHETVNAIFSNIGQKHHIWSSNNLRNMVILMGKGSIEAKYGLIGLKGLKLFSSSFFIFRGNPLE